MIRRTLVPSGAFPYRTASGGLLVGWAALPPRSRLGRAGSQPDPEGRIALNGWIRIAADWLQPIYRRMHAHLLAGDYLQADETPIKCHDPDAGKGAVSQGYLWLISRPGGDVVFDWRLSRRHGELTTLLTDRPDDGTSAALWEFVQTLPRKQRAVVVLRAAGPVFCAGNDLKERGAKKVYAYCTHPIFSGPAIERLSKGTALDEVVVTNTIPLSDAAHGCTKIRQLSVAPLIAETIQRIAKGESVMSLFSDQENLF